MSSLRLSGQESLAVTHYLRAWHQAILVGIRTVLADNPNLSVRLIPGESPQPVVLDSKLRIPTNSNLLNSGTRRPWIATTETATIARQRHLEIRGAEILRFPRTDRGWVALGPLVGEMGRRKIDSLMVEGGARVLTSFMTARLVDQVIITVAPVIVGGVQAFCRLSRDPALLPHLKKVRYANFGKDLMVWGQPVWEEA
jgi:riboflavin-specific deaminase-like protein